MHISTTLVSDQPVDTARVNSPLVMKLKQWLFGALLSMAIVLSGPAALLPQVRFAHLSI